MNYVECDCYNLCKIIVGDWRKLKMLNYVPAAYNNKFFQQCRTLAFSGMHHVPGDSAFHNICWSPYFTTENF
jgi:hypothetical protein